MRLDVALCERSLSHSRTEAKKLIETGLVCVNGVNIRKPAYDISETDILTVTGSICPYVSRGGLKLAAALDTFSIRCEGLVCADIGASSGGFTDCLLQRGASRVYAIENGVGQLAPSLSTDPRVVSLEHMNARYMTADTLPEKVSLVVMDVSFISQTLLFLPVISLMRETATLISLIKPQFEAGRAAVGKGGIVREQKYRDAAIERVREAAFACSLSMKGIMESPIQGGDGNIEFLAYFQRERNSCV